MALRRIHRSAILEFFRITAAACGEQNQCGEEKCFHVMLLQSATRVVDALRIYVRSMRLFWSRIKPNMHVYRSDFYLRSPFAHRCVPSYPKKPAAFVVAPGDALVLGVGWRRRASEICNSVVGFIAVDVVCHLARPLSVHVKPSKPMGGVSLAVNANDNIASLCCLAGNFSNAESLPLGDADKNSSIRIVVKQLAQSLRGKIGLSHEAVLSLIGQRPAPTINRLRASLF